MEMFFILVYIDRDSLGTRPTRMRSELIAKSSVQSPQRAIASQGSCLWLAIWSLDAMAKLAVSLLLLSLVPLCLCQPNCNELNVDNSGPAIIGKCVHVVQ